ncbi:MAG: TIGR04255 family protein [Nitrospira sp.]|nr:TIGR04255 family protein [Nitrospira sp.]
MPIPESPRVRYEKTSLESVVCQLRFPPILKIDSELPSTFQEKIRDKFPHYEEVDQTSNFPENVKKFFGGDLVGNIPLGPKSYNFKSDDEKWTVGLTRDFLAISTVDYNSWETFKDNLNGPLAALNEVYRPSFFTRIGLRYKDVIRKSKLNLSSDLKWGVLLNSHLAGVLSSPQMGESIEEAISNFALKLDNNIGLLRVRHGLASAKNSKEECYLIDCDYFSEEKTEVGNVITKLDKFNRKERDFFRWCISDDLHRAMEPRDINS